MYIQYLVLTLIFFYTTAPLASLVIANYINICIFLNHCWNISTNGETIIWYASFYVSRPHFHLYPPMQHNIGYRISFTLYPRVSHFVLWCVLKGILILYRYIQSAKLRGMKIHHDVVSWSNFHTHLNIDLMNMKTIIFKSLFPTRMTN